jgi:hypothetical protein
MTKEQFEMVRLTTQWEKERRGNLKRINDFYEHAKYSDGMLI